MTDFFTQKKDLRQTMKLRRAGLYREHPEAHTALRDSFLANIRLPPGTVVSAYRALGDEIDPAPLVDVLQTLGHVIVLPVVQDKNQPLVFRTYENNDPLAISSFGVEEPLPTAPILEPDILLVPLLAFDHHFYRLGYGGGFYDRTLQHLRQKKTILAIGLGFAGQQVPAVPHTDKDARLDKIVTDNQAFAR